MPEPRRLRASDTQAVLRRNRSLRALATAIVVGCGAAAVMLLPGVTVDPEGPLDPSSPYPIPFKIADSNLIPLHNVNAYLVICYVVPAPAPAAQECRPPYKTRLFKAAWRDHVLTLDQSFTITLDDFMRLPAGEKFGAADISIIVEYQPGPIPLRQEKEFRFTTELRVDGKLDWVSHPVQEE
jgi:hypothetical protein